MIGLKRSMPFSLSQRLLLAMITAVLFYFILMYFYLFSFFLFFAKKSYVPLRHFEMGKDKVFVITVLNILTVLKVPPPKKIKVGISLYFLKYSISLIV